MPEPDATRIAHVVRRLVGLPQETESTEFKRNYQDPNGIGEYISALANAAALLRRTRAHMIWGVEDETHAFVGTATENARPHDLGRRGRNSRLRWDLMRNGNDGLYDPPAKGVARRERRAVPKCG